MVQFQEVIGSVVADVLPFVKVVDAPRQGVVFVNAATGSGLMVIGNVTVPWQLLFEVAVSKTV